VARATTAANLHRPGLARGGSAALLGENGGLAEFRDDTERGAKLLRWPKGGLYNSLGRAMRLSHLSLAIALSHCSFVIPPKALTGSVKFFKKGLSSIILSPSSMVLHLLLVGALLSNMTIAPFKICYLK